MVVYEVKNNADTTEGRGPMRTYSFYATEKEAIDVVKNLEGVMGRVGLDGEVWRHDIIPGQKSTSTKVWGYRSDRAGRFGVGFIDLREEPNHDPEYQEYLRLQRKFNGRS